MFIKFRQNTVLVILLNTKNSKFKRIDREKGNLSSSIHYISKVRNMEVAHKIMLRLGQLNNLIYDESNKCIYHILYINKFEHIEISLLHDESMCYLLIFYNSLRLSLVVLVVYFHSQV